MTSLTRIKENGKKSKSFLELARWRISWAILQIKFLHGLSEKGELEIFAKLPKIPPINTPPIVHGFLARKRKILAKLWSNFSKEIRPREFKREQEK